jgi:diaminohydroxyphosphoribosylaminopyrimidine deaminase/5-amino-6-(5-phosphoribosylamino)uracil reductase
MLSDTDHIHRAIALAQTARGRVEPNPMVGCVIVKDGRIIGQGCHERYGGPHAEPTALARCTESPAGATVYVTLEPCCHINKKTPPCAPRLIEARIARVVYGCLDPNPDVNGKGVAMLQRAGISVDGPVCEPEAKQLIAPFIALTTLHRPYVTLKWAQTADGKVAGPMGKRIQITGDPANRAVHALRARCDAIAVGTNTVLNDDPLLTARNLPAGAPQRPVLRVVLSNTLKLPTTSQLVATARQQPVLVFCAQSQAIDHASRVKVLTDAGVTVVPLPAHGDGDRFSLDDALAYLAGEHRVTHLLIEPGPTLARHVLPRNQVDRVWVFRSKLKLNDDTAYTAPTIDYPATGSIALGDDELTEYLNPHSAAYFKTEPSADMKLVENSETAPHDRPEA